MDGMERGVGCGLGKVGVGASDGGEMAVWVIRGVARGGGTYGT